jgi:ribonuclease P protein component
MGRSVRLRQRQTAFATRLLRVVSLGNNDHGYQRHLSALCGQAQAHARISGPHAIARRARRAERAPRQGSQATGDLSEGRLTAAYVFSRAHRLQSEAEFAAVAQAGPDSIRLSQRWFVLTARPIEVPSSEAGRTPARGVRFGLTVGTRLARRSVDRVLVKRILREAARHSAPDLEALARTPFDVVLRLKAPLPAQDVLPRGQLKRALRTDADTLLRRFRERLTDRPVADQTT